MRNSHIYPQNFVNGSRIFRMMKILFYKMVSNLLFYFYFCRCRVTALRRHNKKAFTRRSFLTIGNLENFKGKVKNEANSR